MYLSTIVKIRHSSIYYQIFFSSKHWILKSKKQIATTEWSSAQYIYEESAKNKGRKNDLFHTEFSCVSFRTILISYKNCATSEGKTLVRGSSLSNFCKTTNQTLSVILLPTTFLGEGREKYVVQHASDIELQWEHETRQRPIVSEST